MLNVFVFIHFREDTMDAEERRDLKAGVQTYESLLVTVDGGCRFVVDQYMASTILALIENPDYRKRILKRHEKWQARR